MEEEKKQISKTEYLKIMAKEVHKPFRKTFPRRKLKFAEEPLVFAMDLVDCQRYKDENDGYKYILVAIEGRSRKAYLRPMKDKSGASTFEAFEKILSESKRLPKRLWVDEGKEFYNSKFAKWCKDNDAIMYSTFGDHKSVLAERFNKTFSTWIHYKFTERDTERWLDLLPEVLEWYNNRTHSTLKMSPNKAISAEKIPTQEPRKLKKDPRKPRFELGDSVRVSKVKGIFEKGYTKNWSQEVFTVAEIVRYADMDSPIVYVLKDFHDERIQGTFYEQELQLVDPRLKGVYLVEKVLKERVNKESGEPEVLVRWVGYSNKFDSWEPKAAIRSS